jgi:hypothetical protein
VGHCLDGGDALEFGPVRPDLGNLYAHTLGYPCFPGDGLNPFEKCVKIGGGEKARLKKQAIRTPQTHERAVDAGDIRFKPDFAETSFSDTVFSIEFP